MAVGSTFLAIAVAIIAVTSARHVRPRLALDVRNVRQATWSWCGEYAVESAYSECVLYAEGPPAYAMYYQGTAKQNKLVIEQYCSYTFAGIVQCMKMYVKDYGCKNATQISNKVAATGRVCMGDNPAAWLHKGLLDRIGDLPQWCFPEPEYCNFSANSDGGASYQFTYYAPTFWNSLPLNIRLDEAIDCLKNDVKNSCAKVTLFTMELVQMLILESELGAQPSKAKLTSLQSFS